MLQLPNSALSAVQKQINTLNSAIVRQKQKLADNPDLKEEVMPVLLQLQQYLEGYQQCYTDITNSK